jgi:UDP-D-galactose:(glucosyl)LPS alpha-1,6-D-galactosyltransferase
MKILFITRLPLNHYAGTEKVLNTVSKYMSGNGHKVYFLNITDGDKSNKERNMPKPFCDYPNNVFLYSRKDLPSIFYSLKFILNYLFLRKKEYETETFENVFLKISGVDLVLVDPPYLLSGIRRAVSNLCANTKIVLWNHGSLSGMICGRSALGAIRRKIWCFMLNKWLMDADASMAISSGIKDQILSCNHQSNVSLIFNPVVTYPEKLIRRSEKAIFVYVGRIDDYQKNISLLIDSLGRIKNMPDWKLKIFGDGPSMGKIKTLSQKYGIYHRIAWFGYVENPFDLIEEASCLVLTSRFEGFPLVLLEAIERGLPVVSADCPTGPSDVVIQDLNGCLFRSGDVDELAEILGRIVDGKLSFPACERVAKSVGEYGRDKVLKDFERYIEWVVAH